MGLTSLIYLITLQHGNNCSVSLQGTLNFSVNFLVILPQIFAESARLSKSHLNQLKGTLATLDHLGLCTDFCSLQTGSIPAFTQKPCPRLKRAIDTGP
jgi:NhaP-type Na+/H+ or K+/H+ antiporter